ncbi:MAG: DUF2064 domain-containing protein [Bacteroidetes bacterium]|nr:DUF2064 domain-containing protein [Bacteroidota bacterium]
MERALLLFIRNPVRGKVKTRLAAGVGEDQALAIYLRLLEHARQTALAVDCHRFLFYSDSVDRSDSFDNQDFRKYSQCGGDLGTRMDYAFSLPFKMGGYKQVLIIGSDCPGLTPAIVEEGFEALKSHDFVLGPSVDGGYYLLGMTRWQRSLFENKRWSSDSVLADTRNDIESGGGRLHLLPELRDVDTVSDWEAAGRP